MTTMARNGKNRQASNHGGRKPEKGKLSRRPAVIGLLLGLGLGLTACGPGLGPSLRLHPASLPEKDPGITYRLLMYGGMDPNDFETVAILDREDDPWRMVSYTGEIRVKTQEGLTLAEAVTAARQFLSRHNAFQGLEIRELRMADGHTPGYEIKTDYSPTAGRWGDLLDTTYLPGPEQTIIFYVFWPPGIDDSGPPSDDKTP